MKRVLYLAVVCALVFLGLSTTASANTVSITLTGVSGPLQGGVYVSPYYGTVNGIPNTIVVCDDFDHSSQLNTPWTASVSTFSDLSHVRFQGATSAATLQMYNEAAFLFNQLMANPSAQGNISFALWAIFSPNALTSTGFTTVGPYSSQYWLTLAQSQTYYPGEFSNFLVLTPTTLGTTSPQEFLMITPEPATMVLLGSSLLLLAIFLRKSKFLALS